MEIEEYKFDHFKNIDEVMYCFNYWYKEEDIYSINRYLSLKDFNYISNKYQELQKENKELKQQLHDASIQIQELIEKDIWCPSNCEKLEKLQQETNKMIEKCGFVNIEQVMLNYCGLLAQQQEFIKYLEDEKDRLAREVSNIYEDGLGKTRFVKEDIFSEVDRNLQKYKEIIGGGNK